MAGDGDFTPGLDAARRLYELALDYLERSRSAQAALVAEFEDDAAALSDLVGEMAIDVDVDERLVLTSTGRFSGRVLVDKPTESWREINSAEDVAEFYDPTDLFADLADAIAEAYPDVDDGAELDDADEHGAMSAMPRADEIPAQGQLGGQPDESFPVSGGPPGSAAGPAIPNEDEAGESASLRILRDLHAAGVYTDAEFKAKKADLDA
jgi:hypothetical protein